MGEGGQQASLQPPALRVARRRDEPHVLVLRGDLDAAGAPALLRAGTRVLSEGARDVVLDAGELNFADSSGLGAMVRLHKRAVDAGGSVVLCNVNVRLRRLLEIVGLDKVFTIDE